MWCKTHAPKDGEDERAAAYRKAAITTAERAVIAAAVEESVWRRQIDLQRPDFTECTLDGLVHAERAVLAAVDTLIAAREG